MTKQQLKDNGFSYICKQSNGLECWASFTGYLDTIQYYWVNDDKAVSNIMTTSYDMIDMFSMMKDTLNTKQLFQRDIALNGDHWMR